MGVTQVITTSLAGAITVVAAVVVVRAVRRMIAVIRLGQPDRSRSGGRLARTGIMLTETLGHTRMLKWTWVGVAHWFVMIAFILLSSLVLQAYVEVVTPDGELPVVGHWAIFGLVTEILSVTGLVAIGYLIAVRLVARPGRRPAQRSRFVGSTMWQGYFVEWVILLVLLCGLLIRGFQAAGNGLPWPTWAAPVSHALGQLLPSSDAAVSLIALVKILISMTWVIVIGVNVTMGVAWHRFLAFANIFFKRSGGAAPALGALQPMMSKGKPLDFERADPETDQFGVASVEQFTWKGLLDFTTCTECGRCQAQCPAWNTGKPLSPKLLVLSLRDHAYAKAPYLLGGGDLTESAPSAPAESGPPALAESRRPLVGDAAAGGVIDPDTLWSCTTCGACVEQCPVDIEHVDHIVDMRRYQVLIESSFPPEAGVMLRNLDSRGNPWGAPASTRADWTNGLGFEVPRVGDGAEFEYLFWVGCAGAFDDRAKRTTRAVATLLHEAGVSFAILGEGETCTGDPARRLGNEFLFQMLAQQNVATLGAAGVRKIVATCAHCFNTLANEYGQLGGEYDVLHHTQLLAQLVATGRLTPIQPIDGAMTYHDPCYLGRHNRVYSPPRELLSAIGAAGGGGAGSGLAEMPRNTERSFCCGAGGARMWMEERIGKRINTERVEEALATGARTIAAACPFCLTMLSDGVNSKRAPGSGPDEVDVVDVATVLLASVRPTPDPPRS